MHNHFRSWADQFTFVISPLMFCLNYSFDVFFSIMTLSSIISLQIVMIAIDSNYSTTCLYQTRYFYTSFFPVWNDIIISIKMLFLEKEKHMFLPPCPHSHIYFYKIKGGHSGGTEQLQNCQWYSNTQDGMIVAMMKFHWSHMSDEGETLTDIVTSIHFNGRPSIRMINLEKKYIDFE